MPIIHDNPWLIGQLLQSVVDEDERLDLFKKGQATPAEAPVATGLKSILNNLRNQINPAQDSTGAVSHETSGADVFSHNMDSMGDLVQWLANNGTRVGGQAIVYPGNAQRPSEEFGYFKIEPGTEIVVPIKSSDKTVVGYWINPTALKSYLISLQSDQKLKNNVMFQVQLLKLIQDANKQLDLDVSEQYKEPEKTIPDTQVLDTVPQNMDPQQAYGPGNVQLTAGDLKSAITFNAWLSGKSISLKVGERRMMINHPEFDRCAVLKILNQRVKYNADRAATADAQQVAAAYGQRIQAIAKEINCDLGAQSGKEKPGQQLGQGGLSAASPQILMQLSTLRPFNSQFISFPEIKKFLDLYAKYANDQNVSQMVNTINGYIDVFKGYTGMGSDTIQLYNFTTDQFKSMLKNPSAAQIAAGVLYDIAVYSGQLYQRLVTSLQTIAQDPERAKYIDYRAMQQQVTPGGPQLTNVNTLNRLKYNLQQEWNAHK